MWKVIQLKSIWAGLKLFGPLRDNEIASRVDGCEDILKHFMPDRSRQHSKTMFFVSLLSTLNGTLMAIPKGYQNP